ncbi:MAG: hypothetical protein ACT4PO_16520 [Actinomycetota bacterium]
MTKKQQVHARYLGGTPVVMPDLDGRVRCCRPANQRDTEHKAWEEAGPDSPDPQCLLVTGDVILLDPRSAEREDFEIVVVEATPDPTPRKQRS